MGSVPKWLGVLLVAVVAVVLLATAIRSYIPALLLWVEGLGALAPVVFVLVYALTSLLFVPASILTVASGFLFGVIPGTLYSFTGATLAATAAFFISRRGARRLIERRLVKDRRFIRIDRAIRDRGFGVIFLLRLSPIFPLSIVNYSLGLTRVRFRDYLPASIGLLPPTWLYVYNGKLMGDAVGVGLGDLTTGGPENFIVLGVGLIATVVVTVWLARLTQRALR